MQLTVRHLKWQSLSRNLNPSRNPNLSLSRNPSQSPNRNPNLNRNLSPNRNPSRNRNLSPNRNRKFRIIPAPGILPVILPVTAEMGPEKILRQKHLTSLSPAVRRIRRPSLAPEIPGIPETDHRSLPRMHRLRQPHRQLQKPRCLRLPRKLPQQIRRPISLSRPVRLWTRPANIRIRVRPWSPVKLQPAITRH